MHVSSPTRNTFNVTFLLAAGEGGTAGFLAWLFISILTELFGLMVMVLFLAGRLGAGGSLASSP
jgi:hypothetical protein